MTERNVKDDKADDQSKRSDQNSDRDLVKLGGIGRSDAEAEDVSRDTYGFTESEADAPTPEERFAQAERAAEELGIPGIVAPDDETGKEG